MTVRTPLTGGELSTVEKLVSRVDRNIPRHGDPERFHVEKSDIAEGLRRVFAALRTGQPIPNLDQTDEQARRRGA